MPRFVERDYRIEPYGLTDRSGRRYFVWLCAKGHWHRGRNQAVKCNQRTRKQDAKD